MLETAPAPHESCCLEIEARIGKAEVITYLAPSLPIGLT